MRHVAFTLIHIIQLAVVLSWGALSAADYLTPVPEVGIDQADIDAVIKRFRADIPTRWTSATLAASPRIRQLAARLAAHEGFKPSATAQATATARGMTLVPDLTTFSLIAAEIPPSSGDLRSIDYWVVGNNRNQRGSAATVYVHFMITVEITWTWRVKNSTGKPAEFVALVDPQRQEFESHHYILSDADLAAVRPTIMAAAAAAKQQVTVIYGEGDP